jgi:hypothetical protein
MGQVSFNIIKKMILVSWEEKVSFVVNPSDLLFYILALNALATGLVVAMNNLISDIPHSVPSFPNGNNDLCCPELSGFLLSVDTLVK